MAQPTTILVVDDDPDLRDILRSILEPTGFQVMEAADGEAALDVIRRHHPDLVILDYAMPRVDGLHVCHVLKQDLLLRHLPVIMLTGRGEIRDKVHGLDAGADDYLVKPFEPQELLARVRMVLRRTTQELEANPLTKLPGNVSIQKEIESRLSSQAPIAICYADLDRFKAFNDHYGFERGDQVITLTAQILLETVRHRGHPTDFIGHIGGDDFVIVTTPDRAEAICRQIVEQFDATIGQLYDEADRARGYLLHSDRQGRPVNVGFLTISLAVVTNTQRPLSHLGQVAAIGAELKAYAKRFDKSLYVTDHRKTP
jgi:diguanylate cyclase (GGDEF)-like protein